MISQFSTGMFKAMNQNFLDLTLIQSHIYMVVWKVVSTMSKKMNTNQDYFISMETNMEYQ
ncbi:hypothetical protein AM593_06202, partial [Mytilus galloprovincialis]